VRPEAEGVVTSVAARDGEVVHEGDLLIVLDNPPLLSAHDRLTSRLNGLRADHYRLLATDTGAAANLVQRIAAAEAELAQTDARIASLEVRAQVTGTLVMPHQADLIGSFAKRGAALGHVLAPSSLRVRAAVAQDDAELVRHRTRAAEVRLVDAPAERVQATVQQDMPAASNFLPSAALGDLVAARTPPIPKTSKAGAAWTRSSWSTSASPACRWSAPEAARGFASTTAPSRWPCKSCAARRSCS